MAKQTKRNKRKTVGDRRKRHMHWDCGACMLERMPDDERVVFIQELKRTLKQIKTK